MLAGEETCRLYWVSGAVRARSTDTALGPEPQTALGHALRLPLEGKREKRVTEDRMAGWRSPTEWT